MAVSYRQILTAEKVLFSNVTAVSIGRTLDFCGQSFTALISKNNFFAHVNKFFHQLSVPPKL